MKTYLNINRTNWRTQFAKNSKFLRRWTWYIVLLMIAITASSFYLPEIPSLVSYEATLQVQVLLPKAHNDPVNTNISTTFFSGAFTSPDTLALVLPEVNKLKQFSDVQLTDLQTLITAAPVRNTNVMLLTAASDTPQDATFLVTEVYKKFLAKLDSKRAPVISGLNSALYMELTRVQDDALNSAIALQDLKTTGRNTTFQYYLLSKLHAEQQQQVDSINGLLLAFSEQGIGPNAAFLQLGSTAPSITTIPGAQSQRGVRIALSPLIGLIMGVAGALLAERFSTRVPLRGKKREQVLQHIAAILPVIPNLRKSRLSVLQLTAAQMLPLLRRLRYQAGEHERRLKFVTVTSPKGREGKSVVAVNLAIAAAQSGLRTLLIDANPARPMLHTWFHLSNENGTLNTLSDLASNVVGSSPIQDTTVNKLNVVPIGKRGSVDAMSVELRIDRLRPFTDVLSQQADLIIFDAPSLLTNANATNLVVFSDVVVLVVDAKKSNGTKVIEAETLLTEMGVQFATVLNRALPGTVE